MSLKRDKKVYIKSLDRFKAFFSKKNRIQIAIPNNMSLLFASSLYSAI